MDTHILIIDEVHPSLFELLTQHQLHYHYLPNSTLQEIGTILPNYNGLIVRSKLAINEALLQKAPHLRFIGRAGAGLDQIDLQALDKYNIKLFNAPEGNRTAVAEHAVGMLLALFNRLLKADAEVRQKIWNREGNRGVELAGKTVGIIGYGNMGSSVAKVLGGFGCKVIAYDKYHPEFKNNYAESVSMETLFAETDILSLHIPLTTETKNMATTAFWQQFRKNIYFINTARGEIAPLADLLAALQTGKVVGACLDVLENEKLHQLSAEQHRVFEQLAKRQDVIFSPHIAGWTHESYRKINEVLVNKIVTFLAQ
ncbi:MAG: NAD(P)-dependent oxidoreductase [Thermoflexibacteraceae bacterium]|jgi:D-3-phosphoglycerate dehydrogenase